MRLEIWGKGMRRFLHLRRHFSAKPKLDILEYAKQIPDAVSAPQSNSSVENELDWSHLKQDHSVSPEESGASNVTEQKEELIFKEVLSQVLSSSQKHKSSHRPGASKTPLSDSILALFEKSETNKSEDEVSSRQPQGNSGNLLDSLVNSDAMEQASLQAKHKREVAEQQLTEINKIIDNMSTNKSLMEFYESDILSAYSQDSDQSRSPNLQLRHEINDTTVSYILEKCIRTLNEDFKDPTGAIHLFETTKHCSVDLFSVACSAEVYNQIIKIRWYEYRDLYAVVNLAAEIAINAIPPVLETTELLAVIYREAMDSSKGIGSSPYGMPLWTSNEQQQLLELNRYRLRFQNVWASKPQLRF